MNFLFILQICFYICFPEYKMLCHYAWCGKVCNWLRERKCCFFLCCLSSFFYVYRVCSQASNSHESANLSNLLSSLQENQCSIWNTWRGNWFPLIGWERNCKIRLWEFEKMKFLVFPSTQKWVHHSSIITNKVTSCKVIINQFPSVVVGIWHTI